MENTIEIINIEETSQATTPAQSPAYAESAINKVFPENSTWNMLTAMIGFENFDNGIIPEHENAGKKQIQTTDVMKTGDNFSEYTSLNTTNRFFETWNTELIQQNPVQNNSFYSSVVNNYETIESHSDERQLIQSHNFHSSVSNSYDTLESNSNQEFPVQSHDFNLSVSNSYDILESNSNQEFPVQNHDFNLSVSNSYDILESNSNQEFPVQNHDFNLSVSNSYDILESNSNQEFPVQNHDFHSSVSNSYNILESSLNQEFPAQNNNFNHSVSNSHKAFDINLLLSESDPSVFKHENKMYDNFGLSTYQEKTVVNRNDAFQNLTNVSNHYIESSLAEIGEKVNVSPSAGHTSNTADIHFDAVIKENNNIFSSTDSTSDADNFNGKMQSWLKSVLSNVYNID